MIDLSEESHEERINAVRDYLNVGEDISERAILVGALFLACEHIKEHQKLISGLNSIFGNEGKL